MENKDIKIESITSSGEKVYGLGNDQKIYFWGTDAIWHLFGKERGPKIDLEK